MTLAARAMQPVSIAEAPSQTASRNDNSDTLPVSGFAENKQNRPTCDKLQEGAATTADLQHMTNRTAGTAIRGRSSLADCACNDPLHARAAICLAQNRPIPKKVTPLLAHNAQSCVASLVPPSEEALVAPHRRPDLDKDCIAGAAVAPPIPAGTIRAPPVAASPVSAMCSNALVCSSPSDVPGATTMLEADAPGMPSTLSTGRPLPLHQARNAIRNPGPYIRPTPHIPACIASTEAAL